MKIDEISDGFAAALADQINSWQPGKPTIGPGIAKMMLAGACRACAKAGAPIPQPLRRIDDAGVALLRRWSRMQAAFERGESVDGHVVTDIRQQTHRYLYAPNKADCVFPGLMDCLTAEAPRVLNDGIANSVRLIAELRARFGEHPRAYFRGTGALLDRLRDISRAVIGPLGDSKAASWEQFCGFPVVESGGDADRSYAANGWHPIELV